MQSCPRGPASHGATPLLQSHTPGHMLLQCSQVTLRQAILTTRAMQLRLATLMPLAIPVLPHADTMKTVQLLCLCPVALQRAS